MSNTISKHFRDSQIKGVMYIDGRRVLYLKSSVKKKYFPSDIGQVMWEKLEPHLNQELLNYESWEKYYKEIMGVDDYENE